jgi:hypothetical protein
MKRLALAVVGPVTRCRARCVQPSDCRLSNLLNDRLLTAIRLITPDAGLSAMQQIE